MNILFYFIVFFISFPLLAADDTVFAVIGDYGTNSSSEGTVAEVLKSKQPQFVLTLGDNNYTKGCWATIDKHIGKYYQEYIGNYQGRFGEGSKVNRFFPSLGNHDWAAKESCLYHGTLPYFSYFTLPGNQSYYDFVKGPVHFFALDSDPREPDGNLQGMKQYQWFVEKVSQSSSPFKVVYFHHAPFSSGYHGSNKDMQWDFASLGIDVVMSGHDHDYERIERDGVVYFVNGVGGSSLYSMRKKVKESKFFYNKHHGFMLITANDTNMNIQFINNRNHIKDQIVLKK